MEKRVIGDVELAYRTAGDADARPIILVHGLTANAGDWSETTRSLVDAGWRVLAPDCPGHGHSSAPGEAEAYGISHVAELLHDLALGLGWTPAVIVGNSMGGAIAQEYAIRHPGDVTALVLVDSAGDLRAPLPRSPQHADFVAAELALAFDEGMEAVWKLHQERQGWMYSGAASPDVQARRKARFCLTSPQGYIYGDRALGSRRNTLPQLAGLNVRTLVICCEKEALFLKHVSDDLAATIPGAKYEIIPHAWHQPHLENPQVFNEVLLNFIGAV